MNGAPFVVLALAAIFGGMGVVALIGVVVDALARVREKR